MERLTPEQAAEQLACENHISIVFEQGFEEGSKTANEFRQEIYGERDYENACVRALLGGEFIYESFLNNSKFERNAVEDIVKYGDWHYIILHDRKHPTEPNTFVGIWNSEKPMEEESEEAVSEVARLALNPQESYTVLSMVQDCISQGMVANNYQVDRLEKLIEEIDDPFEDFKKDLEFEVQIVVRKRGNQNASN